jgi:hypothetical protein
MRGAATVQGTLVARHDSYALPPWHMAVSCRGAHTLDPTLGGDLTAVGHEVGRAAVAVTYSGRLFPP